MKKEYFIYIVLGILIAGSVVVAQETANIQYPVEELGNCENESDCRSYCDEPDNQEACLDFAQRNNLMSEEEVEQAKKFIAAGSKGPGGCKGKDSCEEYCNDINNIEECISFAEKSGLMSGPELEEAKKVQAAIARGVKPPPCNTKAQCDAYCENPEHMEECINFGVEAGFIQGKEAEDAQKMLQAIKRGIKPPPCKGKEDCDDYCSSPDNMEECMNFAMEAGFMSEQEKADSQKMLQALKRGIKPPPCKGKEECDVYCGEEGHFEECMNFAEAAGFMTAEESAMARKTGGKGPGGCKGREECEAFCNNPDNQETCFNFAKDNGMMPEEELKRMEEGKQQNFQPGPGQINPGGEMMPQQAGPGGCKTPEECQSFCQNNPEQCQGFGPPEGQQQTVPPSGEFQPPPEFNQEQGVPPADFQQQNFQAPPVEQQPPPAGFIINTDSFVGSLLYAAFNFLISAR